VPDTNYLDVELHTSPHFSRQRSVENIMLNVVWALIPIVLFSIFKYGLSAIAVIATTTLSCLLSEFVISRIVTKNELGTAESSLGDYSAVITGILLGLTLPPGLPLWMAFVGGVVAIVVGKWTFGGLGQNPFNPALVSRIILQATFPVPMTTWYPAWSSNRFSELISSTLTTPFMQPVTDGVTGATVLAVMKFEHIFLDSFSVMLLGEPDGSLGEISPLLILLCGGYLALRKMLDWRIPAAIFTAIILFSVFFHLLDDVRFPPSSFMLLSGGLMLGAVFMATDMVSSPVTPWGVWIYGCLIGFLVVIIRLFGGLPEGVAYAIVLANSVVPILNQLTKPKVYGIKTVSG
jgi:electron transport complex protein RnfD